MLTDDKWFNYWFITVVFAFLIILVSYYIIRARTDLTEIISAKYACAIGSIPISIYGYFYLEAKGLLALWNIPLLLIFPIVVYFISPRGPFD